MEQTLEEFFKLSDEFGERGRCKREEESKKGNGADHFPLCIERRPVIHRSRVLETEKDDEDEQEKPSRIVENGDKGHNDNCGEENDAASAAEKGICDMPAIELTDGKKIEGGDKETHPSRITDRMQDDIVVVRHLSQYQSLEETEKERIRQANCPFPELRDRNDL